MSESIRPRSSSSGSLYSMPDDATSSASFHTAQSGDAFETESVINTVQTVQSVKTLAEEKPSFARRILTAMTESVWPAVKKHALDYGARAAGLAGGAWAGASGFTASLTVPHVTLMGILGRSVAPLAGIHAVAESIATYRRLSKIDGVTKKEIAARIFFENLLPAAIGMVSSGAIVGGTIVATHGLALFGAPILMAKTAAIYAGVYKGSSWLGKKFVDRLFKKREESLPEKAVAVVEKLVRKPLTDEVVESDVASNVSFKSFADSGLESDDDRIWLPIRPKSLSENNVRLANISDFTLVPEQAASGATGSEKYTGPGGAFYRLKKSIGNATLTRKLKTGWTNRENLAEFIAGTVTASISPKHVARVALVNNPKEKQVWLASEYLPETYASIGKKTGEPIEVSDKADFAKVVALSALSGDHDINPENVFQDGQGNFARIDLGHALNDLTRALSPIVQRKASENRIIDYFNRETVDGMPGNDKSKLWQHYVDGLVPSREMAKALRDLCNEKTRASIWNGLEESKETLLKFEDKETQQKIRDSLLAINATIDGDDAIKEEPEYESLLNRFFDHLKEFYEKNLLDMAVAANLMELQCSIEENKDKKIMLPEGISGTTKYEWLKTNAASTAFMGTFNEYVEERRRRS